MAEHCFQISNNGTIKFLMPNDKCDVFLAGSAGMWQKWGTVNEGLTMLKTIMIGRYLSIQGQFVRTTPTGLVVVKVGDKTFAGRPVQKRHAA
ncbi:hypothetical protein MASR1M49_40760 [Pararhodobacter aggregans]